jgi:hypothetical protein
MHEREIHLRGPFTKLLRGRVRTSDLDFVAVCTCDLGCGNMNNGRQEAKRIRSIEKIKDDHECPIKQPLNMSKNLEKYGEDDDDVFHSNEKDPRSFPFVCISQLVAGSKCYFSTSSTK